MNFNALKRSFCFGLLASVHVRDHVRAVVREKLQRSTTANSIVPCSTFFAAHHRVSKKGILWVVTPRTVYNFPRYYKDWYFLVHSRLQSDSFSSWHQKSCFVCVLTLLKWLIIRFDLKTNSKQQLFLQDCQRRTLAKKNYQTKIFTTFQSMLLLQYCLRDKSLAFFYLATSFLVSKKQHYYAVWTFKIKFRYCEKVTKIWKNLPLCFDTTK